VILKTIFSHFLGSCRIPEQQSFIALITVSL
jgi:hypothetical protein